MTNQQGAQEALRLADEITASGQFTNLHTLDAAAAMLRRLHAENERLAALIEAQQPAPSAAGGVFDEPDEVIKLRALAATCYAGLGAECNLPENWLDALNAAANGEPFTTSGLLPYKAQPSPTPQADSQPAVATQQAGDDLAELSLLNRLIELGGKAAGAHATSNSDDGPKGTAAYVQWQELRAEMGELIRRFYSASLQPPTAQAADSQPAPEAAWEYAAKYEGDDRQDMRTDVFNAFCAGAKHAARAPADSVTAPAGGAVAGPTMPAEFLRSVIALCTQRGYSPENIEAWSKDDKWVADLWRKAEQMLAAAPTPPAQAADSVQDLQPVHDAVTIDLLNERVAYLESKLKAADSVLEDAARLDHLQKTGSTIEMLPGVQDFSPMRFRVGGLHAAVSTNVREAIDAARKQGANHG